MFCPHYACTRRRMSSLKTFSSLTDYYTVCVWGSALRLPGLPPTRLTPPLVALNTPLPSRLWPSFFLHFLARVMSCKACD